jgi:hypothetical protein
LAQTKASELPRSQAVAFFSKIENLEKIWGFYGKIDNGFKHSAQHYFLKIFYQFNHLYNQIHVRAVAHSSRVHPEYRYNYFLAKLAERLLSGDFERKAGHLPGKFWELVFQTSFEKAGIPRIFIRDVLKAPIPLSHKQLMLGLPQIQGMRRQLLRVIPDIAKVLEAFYFDMPHREYDRMIRRAENLEKIFHEKQHSKVGQLAWVQATAFYSQFLSVSEISEVLLYLKPQVQRAFFRAAGIDNLLEIFEHLAYTLPPYNEVPVYAMKLGVVKNKVEMPGMTAEEAQTYYNQKKLEYDENGHQTELPDSFEDYMKPWDLVEEQQRVVLIYAYDQRFKNLAAVLKNSKHFEKIHAVVLKTNADFAEALSHGLAGSHGFYTLTQNVKPADIAPERFHMPANELLKAFLRHKSSQFLPGEGI